MGAAAVIGIAIAVIATIVQLAFLRPKQPQAAGREDLLQQTNPRQPTPPRNIIYGFTRIGGPFAFMGTTNNQQFLQTAILHAGHEVTELGDYVLDGELERVVGELTQGPSYPGGAIRLRPKLGQDAQVADVDMVSEIPEWTTSHRLQGISYTYARFEGPLLPEGRIPTVTVMVKGKKVFDPRDSQTKFSLNPALFLRDYFTDTRLGLGLSASRIVDADVIAAANICEEMVTVKEQSDTFIVDVAEGNNIMSRTTSNARWFLGDEVEVSATTSLPSGLAASTPYYMVPVRFILDENGKTTWRLASSYANALAGTTIAVSDDGVGTLTITRKKEPRYTASGLVNTEEDPAVVVRKLLTAMHGKVIRTGSEIIIRAGAFQVADASYDDGDVVDTIKVQGRSERSKLANGVRGIFVDPYKLFEPDDFPAVDDAGALAEDQNVRIWKDVELPFTTSPSMAQRLAKIDLAETRFQRGLSSRFKMLSMKTRGGDTVQFQDEDLGLSVLSPPSATDKSSSNHPITFVNNASLSNTIKQFGIASLSLDGIDSYISIPDDVGFTFGSGAFTIQAWIRRNVSGVGHAIVSKYRFGVDGEEWSFEVNSSDQLTFFYSLDGTTTANTWVHTTTIPAGVWTQVAVSRLGGGDVILFVNGEAQNVGNETSAFFDSVELVNIGRRSDSSVPFNGNIDQVEITKGGAIWTQDFVPPEEPGVVLASHTLYLKFDGAPMDFEVTQWTLTMERGAGGSDAPLLSVAMSLKETNSTIFDFLAADEIEMPIVLPPTFPDLGNVEPPGSPVLVSGVNEIFLTADNTVSARLRVSWMNSPNGFVIFHDVQFKKTSDTQWLDHEQIATPEAETLITGLTPGEFYDVRVRARNRINAVSVWATTLNFEFAVSGQVPQNITGLTISAIGGSAVLRWQSLSQIDVLAGGEIRFRWSPETDPNQVQWSTSTSIGRASKGSDQIGVIPLKPGTYLVRPFNRQGTGAPVAGVAAISTKQATVLTFVAAATSIVEDPGFLGTRDGVVVDGTTLKIEGAGFWDAIADFDVDVVNLDSVGGVRTEGVYTFLNGFDFTTVTKVRLTLDIDAAAVNELDFIDSRLGLVDTYPDWDGTEVADVDAIVEASTTDDDPAGTQTAATDESLAPHTLTFVGDAEISSVIKRLGTGSLGLDGTGDFVTAPDSADWLFDDEFTIHLWFRTDLNYSGLDVLISQWDDSVNDDRSWTIFVRNDGTLSNAIRAELSVNGIGFTQLSVEDVVIPGIWHHVALTRDTSDDARLFLDGKLIAGPTSVVGSLHDSPARMVIGGHDVNGVLSAPFHGHIDQVEIVKGAALWAADFSPPIDPPDDPTSDHVLWVDFNDTRWSDFNKLDASEFEARAVRFQARLTSESPSFNILVDKLSINADKL